MFIIIGVSPDVSFGIMSYNRKDEGEIVSDTGSEIEEELIPDDNPRMENEYNLEFFETKSERGKSLLTRGLSILF